MFPTPDIAQPEERRYVKNKEVTYNIREGSHTTDLHTLCCPMKCQVFVIGIVCHKLKSVHLWMNKSIPLLKLNIQNPSFNRSINAQSQRWKQGCCSKLIKSYFQRNMVFFFFRKAKLKTLLLLQYYIILYMMFCWGLNYQVLHPGVKK